MALSEQALLELAAVERLMSFLAEYVDGIDSENVHATFRQTREMFDNLFARAADTVERLECVRDAVPEESVMEILVPARVARLALEDLANSVEKISPSSARETRSLIDQMQYAIARVGRKH